MLREPLNSLQPALRVDMMLALLDAATPQSQSVHIPKLQPSTPIRESRRPACFPVGAYWPGGATRWARVESVALGPICVHPRGNYRKLEEHRGNSVSLAKWPHFKGFRRVCCPTISYMTTLWRIPVSPPCCVSHLLVAGSERIVMSCAHPTDPSHPRVLEATGPEADPVGPVIPFERA